MENYENYHQEATNIFCMMIQRWDRYKNDYIELYGEDAYYYFYQFENDGDHTTFFDYTIDIVSDTDSCDDNMDDVSFNYQNDTYGWEYDKYY